jgi:hypothetical protein
MNETKYRTKMRFYHPSAKGNEKIAQTVLNKLYDLKLGSSTKPVITTKGKDKK